MHRWRSVWMEAQACPDVNTAQNMKRTGNVESNKFYNPRNVKPQIPIDIDEVDSAMERFIRQKYEQRAFMNNSQPGTRHNTGSTSSVEDKPPPLPPKPTKRFGFGLQKSPANSRNTTPPISPGISPGLSGFGENTSPPRVNKPSRVFGSSVNTSGDGLESKLATLRDMGFPDEKKNSTVLKGLNGNLDKAVEALIRLGEQNNGRSRGNTPTPPAKSPTNGLSFDNSRLTPNATTSTNPFEALDTVAPLPQQNQQLPSQAAQYQAHQTPFGSGVAQPISPNPYNPFMGQQQQAQTLHRVFSDQQLAFTQQQQPQGQNPYTQPQQGLEQSFHSLQLSNTQPPQQLFPNRTGGYGQPISPQYPQTNPFLQSFTPPPMPQMPQQYAPFFQSATSPTAAANPFLKSTRSQMFTPISPSANPFLPSSTQQNQPVYSQPQVQSPVSWQTQQQPIQDPNQNIYHTQQQFQSQTYPRPAADKSSILALYNNYPQLGNTPLEQAQPTPAPAPGVVTSPSTSTPTPGSLNPFAASQTPQPAAAQAPSAPAPEAPPSGPSGCPAAPAHRARPS